jgi:peptidoglycan/xylan/chitin deacetylase (PgdA/CDA1 family)
MWNNRTKLLKHIIRHNLARSRIKFGKKRANLMILLFHSIYGSNAEREKDLVYPHIGMTVDNFRLVIEYYLSQGFIFVSPDEILSGLKDDKNYLLITFDDGYYNNLQIIPLLQEYRIPAIFFIATHFIRENVGYWWDIIHRACRKKSMSNKEIDVCVESMKKCAHVDMASHLLQDYGITNQMPVADIDRPLTPDELKDLAQDKLVHIGNHTSHHATLTNYSEADIRQQIQVSQTDIHDLVDKVPSVISYPNGNYSKSIIEIAQQCGLQMGITMDNAINPVPINRTSPDIMTLGRFMPVEMLPIVDQCRIYHGRTRGKR